jgi:hypothetical protein
LELTNVSANISVAIFRVTMDWFVVLASLCNSGFEQCIECDEADNRAALPYTSLPKMANKCTVTVKMAAAISADTSDNLQHLMWLIPESRSSTSNSGNEN